MLEKLIYLIKVIFFILLGAIMLKIIVEVCLINTLQRIKQVKATKKLSKTFEKALDEAVEQALKDIDEKESEK